MIMEEFRNRLVDPDDDTGPVGLWTTVALFAIVAAGVMVMVQTALPGKSRPDDDRNIVTGAIEKPLSPVQMQAPTQAQPPELAPDLVAVPREVFEELDTYRLQAGTMKTVVAALRSENIVLGRRLGALEAKVGKLTEADGSADATSTGSGSTLGSARSELLQPMPLIDRPMPIVPEPAKPAEKAEAAVHQPAVASPPDESTTPPASVAAAVPPPAPAAAAAADPDTTGSIFARATHASGQPGNAGPIIPTFAPPDAKGAAAKGADTQPETAPVAPELTEAGDAGHPPRSVLMKVNGRDTQVPLPAPPRPLSGPSAAAAQPVQPMRVRFGIDIGSAPTPDGLQPIWADFTKLAPPIAAALRPVGVLKNGASGPQLHLVAGPFASEVDAKRGCSLLEVVGKPCTAVPYEGRPLALK